MEMVFLQAFSAANDEIRQITALFRVLPEYLTKVEGSNKQIGNERVCGVATNR